MAQAPLTVPADAASSTAGNALRRLLKPNRPLLMGILNLTPDSFSDGGCFVDPETARRHADGMIAAGADIIDIGAESTRPYGGAEAVSRDDEIARLSPVLPAVIATGVPVSIDTMKAEVADWAVGLGAQIINDVWALQRDPAMAAVVARRRVPVIVMHNRDKADDALDIMADIDAFFRRTLDIADTAGVPRDAIVLDPGIGFGKTPRQSMEAITKLDRLCAMGLPILVGASRKRFIASVSPSEPMQRIGGSLAAHVIACQNGARIIRAHDVAETVQALRVAAALRSF